MSESDEEKEAVSESRQNPDLPLAVTSVPRHLAEAVGDLIDQGKHEPAAKPEG